MIVPHCILNTASKVMGPLDELETQNRKRFLEYAVEEEIQMLQLPCPEMIQYGVNRFGHVKNQFDHEFFRRECRKMLDPLILQIKEYSKYPERFDIIGILAINQSPSCGIRLTCKGNWKGEISGAESLEKVAIVEEPGVYMEEIMKLLEQEQLIIKIKDLGEFISELSYTNKEK